MCLSLLPKTSRIWVGSCSEGKLESCLHFRKNYKMSTQLRKIVCRKEWQLTPVFLPGEPNGQRSLAGYSPWGHKESDASNTHTSLYSLLLQYLHSYGRELKSFPFQQNGILFWNVLSNALGSDIPLEPRLEVLNINCLWNFLKIWMPGPQRLCFDWFGVESRQQYF